jgi:hypothetical protein
MLRGQLYFLIEKTIPVLGRRGLEDFEVLKFPHFLDSMLTGDDEAVSVNASGAHYPQRTFSRTYFFQRLSQPENNSAVEWNT